MKLNTKAMAIASGLTWAGAVFAVGLVNIAKPTYGRRFLKLIGSVYPGYHARPMAKDVAIGTACAMLDGAAAGVMLGVLYNQFAGGEQRPEELSRAA